MKNNKNSIIVMIILIIISYTAISNNSLLNSVHNDADASIEFQDEVIKPKPSNMYFEIRRLSEYIKLRKSNQPQEICDVIAEEVIKQSRKNNIPDEIVVGIIEVESLWDPCAKSSKDAKGLMQVLVEDGVNIDQNKIYDIKYNIFIGIEIFKSKLKKSNGDLSVALKYYVGGDPKYHESVYKSIGRFTLYKISTSTVEISRSIDINNERG